MIISTFGARISYTEVKIVSSILYRPADEIMSRTCAGLDILIIYSSTCYEILSHRLLDTYCSRSTEHLFKVTPTKTSHLQKAPAPLDLIKAHLLRLRGLVSGKARLFSRNLKRHMHIR
jgi:hypothetical protein